MSEFTGFAAFASHTSTASNAAKLSRALSSASSSTITGTNTNNNSNNNTKSTSQDKWKPSPIYIGSNANLIQLFKRIGQKRDAVTKCRALSDFCSFAYPHGQVPVELKKVEQIEALSHYFFLFPKLIQDNNMNVRCEAIKVMGEAMEHIPKAFKNCILYNDDHPIFNNSEGTTDVITSTVVGNVVGWIYTSQSSQFVEISKCAKAVWMKLQTLFLENADNYDTPQISTNSTSQQHELIASSSSSIDPTLIPKILQHITSILQFSSKPKTLMDALSILGSSKHDERIDNNTSNKKKRGGKDKNQIKGNDEKSNENDVSDEIEERYERIVLLTLRGANLLLTSYPESVMEQNLGGFEDGTTKVEPQKLYIDRFGPNVSLLCKHLSSPKPIFRRTTYDLITCICQNSKSLVYPSHNKALNQNNDIQHFNISNQLLNALSSEKDHSNIQSLLEMLLVYITSFQPKGIRDFTIWKTNNIDESDSKSSSFITMDATVFVKAMSKLLKRSCYGCSAPQWTPIILPLLACIPHHEQILQYQLVSSLWSGRTAAVSQLDIIHIASAVAECSTFLLLRPFHNDSQVETIDHELSVDFGQFFLDTLLFFLENFSSPTTHHEVLLETLARDLKKIDALGSTRRSCHFWGIKDWFWVDGMRSILFKNDEFSYDELKGINALLKCFSTAPEDGEGVLKNTSTSNFRYILRVLVNQLLKDKSALALSTDEACFILLAFEYCGITFVFDGEYLSSHDKDIKSFCLNDLLVWIILHTSAATHVKSSLHDVRLYFKILLHVLNSIESDQDRMSIWDTVVREIIKAECDLKRFAIGLDQLSAEPNYTKIFPSYCDVLEVFVQKVGENMVEDLYSRSKLVRSHEEECESDDGVDDDKYYFLRTCVGLGLNDKLKPKFVGFQVINEWIQKMKFRFAEYRMKSYTYHDYLLDIIIDLCYSGSIDINEIDVMNILMISWRKGGPTWVRKQTQSLLIKKESTLTSFITAASESVQKEIAGGVLLSKGDNIENALYWSHRAWRLLALTQTCHGSVDASLVGINNTTMWKSALGREEKCRLLHACLVHLLDNFKENEERRDFICSSTFEANAIVLIFMASVPPDDDIITWNGTLLSKCEVLLNIIGLETFLSNVEYWCCTCVEILSGLMNNVLQGNQMELSTLSRGVQVLDWLVSLMQEKILIQKEGSNNSDMIDPFKVKEGDTLWYLLDREDGTKRSVPVTIIDIHHDDYPNLYFTVQLKVEEEGLNKIRQTIPSRLTSSPYEVAQNIITIDDLGTPDPNRFVKKIEEEVVMKLIKPYINGTSDVLRENASEILNIIISRCGFRGKAGIGSLRFEIQQQIRTLEIDTMKLFVQPDPDLRPKIAHLIRCLAFVFGYGYHTSASRFNSEIMRIDVLDLTKTLVESYRETYSQLEYEEVADINQSIQMFLTAIASSASITDDMIPSLWDLMMITSLVGSKCDVSTSMFARSVKAFMLVYDSTKNSTNHITSIASIEGCISNLIEIFVNYHEGAGDMCTVQSKIWFDQFENFIKVITQDEGTMAAQGINKHIGELCTSLSSPIKRWCAYHLLMKYTRKFSGLCSDDDVTLAESTGSKLDSWKLGMDPDEGDELEEDVLISAKWLPHNLMCCLESWKEESFIDTEDAVTSRLLCWLVFLQVLDRAAGIDMRNRSHLTSYIAKTEAMNEIMSLALEHGDLTRVRPTDMLDLLDRCDDECFTVSQLASLVIFRSVESIPTLSKSWWNEYCPRSKQSVIVKFVETLVAPETLKRELNRINKAKSLGEMVVNGSCVSREITSIYVQDECKLSVTIKVPPSFPLRNVEVDCQKTLGISEKRWRYWSLQIMLMLNSQDGSILDAILLWKQNVDREFEGVEPCPVCYSVLCVKTHSMPNLECKTCKNRFHSSCLFKWFHSSGKNLCVICQQPWSGTKITS